MGMNSNMQYFSIGNKGVAQHPRIIRAKTIFFHRKQRGSTKHLWSHKNFIKIENQSRYLNQKNKLLLTTSDIPYNSFF